MGIVSWPLALGKFTLPTHVGHFPTRLRPRAGTLETCPPLVAGKVGRSGANVVLAIRSGPRGEMHGDKPFALHRRLDYKRCVAVRSCLARCVAGHSNNRLFARTAVF